MTAKNKTVQWVRLGDYITQRREKNSGLSLPIRGVTSDGFIPPKQLDANTMLYNVFYKKDFVFNPARMELNSIALNADYEKAICSSLYEIFYVNKPDKLLPEYLNLYIKRGEFARYCWYDAIGSARNYFRVANMQDIRIPLPSLEVQRELVDTYTGLQRLAEDNEALIAPLTEACQAFIVDCQKKYPMVKLGDYITQRREKNSGLSLPIRGVTSDGFIPPKQLDANTMLYNVFYKKDFVFNPARMELNSIALNADYEKAICSSLYEIFYVNKPDELLPEYLNLYIKRGEFARYCWYEAIGSARNYFRVANMQDIRIPLPPLEVQESIVNLYHCIEEARKIAREARAQLQNLCPALIQYAEHN